MSSCIKQNFRRFSLSGTVEYEVKVGRCISFTKENMVQIGKINRLTIKGIQSLTIHLDGGALGDILLKSKKHGQKYKPGDEVDVFVYVNKEQNLIATTQPPYATVGDFCTLTVVATSEAGAFLGWGLEDDLFVPKSEQQDNMKVGKSYVVFIFHSEKTNRITASSKIEKYLSKLPPPYSEGEEVNLLIYAKTNLGYSAIVNSSHVGLIYQNEIFQKLVIGQQIQGYIKKIREDRKIDLTLQQTGYQRIDEMSQSILNIIKTCGGTVQVTDKSPAEDIYELFGMSKKVFKKAIGSLYKNKRISLETDSIKLSEETNSH